MTWPTLGDLCTGNHLIAWKLNAHSVPVCVTLFVSLSLKAKVDE